MTAPDAEAKPPRIWITRAEPGASRTAARLREAARAAAQFRDTRMPKFLQHFDDAVTSNQGDWLIDHRWTYADTSLFQVVEGLRYMFPRRMATIEGDYPALLRIRDQVAELPGIKAYLKSDRRLSFNTDGIFRHYPELDGE